MGGRRRLRGAYAVWLPDHRLADGIIFRRYLRAGEEITGHPNGSERLRVEIRRYAISGVVYERASVTWATLATKRTHGKGRRPTDRQVERAARRLGLADGTLKEATARLEQLAAQRTGHLDLARSIQQQQEHPR